MVAVVRLVTEHKVEALHPALKGLLGGALEEAHDVGAGLDVVGQRPLQADHLQGRGAVLEALWGVGAGAGAQDRPPYC